LTNAFKYGLSKTNHPCLAIKLRNDDVLLLDIADNGPGLDAVSWDSKTTSFGRRLIDGLTRQLNGQYTLSHEAGTRFDFRFPIPQDLPLFA
jgi:two-component sensor histidine kinase